MILLVINEVILKMHGATMRFIIIDVWRHVRCACVSVGTECDNDDGITEIVNSGTKMAVQQFYLSDIRTNRV